jgi:hypothetical protein
MRTGVRPGGVLDRSVDGTGPDLALVHRDLGRGLPQQLVKQAALGDLIVDEHCFLTSEKNFDDDSQLRTGGVNAVC